MFILPNYVISEQIHESSRVKVYRGYSLENRVPVILKVLEKEYAEPDKIASLIHEYEITRSLNIEGVIRPEKIVQTSSVVVLITRDLGAISLNKYIQTHSIDLQGFLKIAIQISETLGRLHNHGIVHGDLKPSNVLIDTYEKVYIIDFGSAISLLSKNQNPLLQSSERTFEYMPPEQTGLLNIGIDYRSDFYSLGVMLYELITGVIPFKAEEQDAWANAHITQTAQPPHKVLSSVPRTVSDIIMKLLAKSPEERYQSANGLLYDLKECYSQLLKTGEVHFFNVGRKDVPEYFNLPQKLIGRDNEKQVLIDVFKRVCRGETETILISGDPGVGKTMLIEKSLKTIASEKGFYITGKFDQLKSNIPYAPFAYAFGNLIRQLMIKSEKELNDWKKAIQHALGRRGSVIAQVIPELEWIIGKQQPVDELSPNEAQNRFLMVFRDFVKVFAKAGHPLVIFIDDLQWADYSSIKLLKYLSQDANLRYILFVGAFRDNEISEEHPIADLLAKLETGQLTRQGSILNLKPLHDNHFVEIIAECFNVNKEDVGILSEVLFRKTGGNPLFLGQLLAYTYEEGLIFFQQHNWKWDIEAIDALRLGEDVLEFLIKKLDRLPKATQEILKIAACIGNRFDIHVVSKVCCQTAEESVSYLMPALLERLVIPEKQLQNTAFNILDEKAYTFEFLHDRVQQAVYSPIPEQ